MNLKIRPRLTKLKNALVKWSGFGLTDSATWAAWFGSRNAAGVHVTQENALKLSAVLACVRLIAQTIATLPLGFFEKLADGGRAPADDKLRLAQLLSEQPNADTSAVQFWEGIVGQMLLRGNGFAEKQRIGGRLVALDLLECDRLTWNTVGGRLRYSYTGEDGSFRYIEPEDVWHVPGFSLGGKWGMSMIRYGAEVIGNGIAANSAASSIFKEGLILPWFFKLDKFLTPTQRKEFNGDPTSGTTGINDGVARDIKQGKAPILEGGMDIGTTGLNPDDAQLLASRQWSVEEICRLFGVPPSMIGSTDKASSWASSSEQIAIWFLQYGLRPILKRIEQAIKIGLMTPAEKNRYYPEFAVEGLLRADTAARTAFYNSALQNGYLNRNEVRMLENRPKVDGLDVFTAQSNLLPVAQLGQQTTAPAANDVANALKAWLGIKELTA